MTGETIQSVVIIGGGQAGAQAVQALRKRGYEGAITLIGEEEAPPYQRPPLSKAFLKGELAEERLFFKPLEYYETAGVAFRPGVVAQAIDRAAGRVALDGGETIAYDRLLIATGSRPRPLPVPGADLNGVLELRSLADSKRLRGRVEPGKRLTVIGGGYIGLETAAAARQLGLEVVVLERMPRLLQRVTSPVVSDFYLGLHRAEGVDVRCACDVSGIASHVEGGFVVQLSGGDSLRTDLVLIGIGVVPNQELARAAGLPCDNGIVVNEHAQTEDPRIYAAGDCTSRPLEGRDGRYRLESVHNALEQADQASAHMLGLPAPPLDVPWFWSDQYDVKLQTAGVLTGYDEVVTRGDPGARSFAAFHYRDGALLAVDAINDPHSFMATKQLLKRGVPVSPADAADVSRPLKDLLRSSPA